MRDLHTKQYVRAKNICFILNFWQQFWNMPVQEMFAFYPQMYMIDTHTHLSISILFYLYSMVIFGVSYLIFSDIFCLSRTSLSCFTFLLVSFFTSLFAFLFLFTCVGLLSAFWFVLKSWICFFCSYCPSFVSLILSSSSFVWT